MKKELSSRKDLELLVGTFYERVMTDPEIGFLFTEVAKINLEKHLPVITDFWEMNLFQTGGYRRNPMQVHLDLHAKSPLKEAHFKRWLQLFHQTTDDLFEGRVAETAKQRATSIATIMQIKLAGS